MLKQFLITCTALLSITAGAATASHNSPTKYVCLNNQTKYVASFGLPGPHTPGFFAIDPKTHYCIKHISGSWIRLKVILSYHLDTAPPTPPTMLTILKDKCNASNTQPTCLQPKTVCSSQKPIICINFQADFTTPNKIKMTIKDVTDT